MGQQQGESAEEHYDGEKGMNKHTQGPWEFVDNSLVGPKIDNKPVWLRPVILRSETGIAEADARLIAAAPDLLEALENIADIVADEWGTHRPCVMRAYAAIAKARGQE